jgi:hypothetical protein
MKSYRAAVLALIIHLTVFFNIERLDFGAENIIDIDTFVYILTIVAVLIVIASGKVAKLSLLYGYIFWLGVYLIIKLFINPSHSPLVGGVYTYLSITEVTFLSIALLLAHNAARLIDDVEQTIMGITLLGTTDKVKIFEEASDNIKLEIYRSRRYGIPISLLLVSPEESSSDISINQTLQEFQDDILKHYTIVRLTRILNKFTRRTDLLLVKFDNNQIGLLSLGLDKEKATELAVKIKEIAKSNLGVNIRIGITTFPEEAETFDKMYQLANTELRKVSDHKKIKEQHPEEDE